MSPVTTLARDTTLESFPSNRHELLELATGLSVGLNSTNVEKLTGAWLIGHHLQVLPALADAEAVYGTRLYSLTLDRFTKWLEAKQFPRTGDATPAPVKQLGEALAKFTPSELAFVGCNILQQRAPEPPRLVMEVIQVARAALSRA